MKIRALLSDRYVVAAALNGEKCPAEDFLATGEASQQASRDGLVALLQRVAEHGLATLSCKHSHEVDKRHGIYEFIKGDLRLMYFKGNGNTIVVCTTGVLKKGQSANKRAVAAAIELQKQFRAAINSGTLEWDDTEAT